MLNFLLKTIRKAFLLLTLSFILFPSLKFASAEENSGIAGISNHGKNKTKPYAAAGDRTYIIGTQDGNFPDIGHHVKGEMGGLWLHPIKLMDGFWVKVIDASARKEAWLSDAVEFINYPFGNRFRYAPILDGLEIERFQFCPDGRQGMIVEYSIRNPGNRTRVIKFEFSGKTDLSPVWFSKENGIEDYPDEAVWDASNHFFVGKDKGQPWFVIWGSNNPANKQSVGNEDIPETTIGSGTAATAEYSLSIAQNSKAVLTFIIAGSAKNKKDAIDSYQYLSKHHSTLLEAKKSDYASVIERARINIPDQALQQVYDWVKINTEWLIRDVPGVGRGLGAGLPEYPWWFGCDNTYSLQGVMATGDFELAKQTLRLLKDHSMKKNGNGRIVHEITTNGAVYNPGNTQETAHFILCVEKLFEWTGDLDFIKEMYPVMKMGLHWLLTDMDQNKNLFPEGYGIMEVHGLNAELIDVAVYTQQALKATAHIAGILKDGEAQKEYEQLSKELAVKINEDFWDESENSYTDFYGTRAQAIRAAEGAITQLKLHSDEAPSEKINERIAFYENLKNKFTAMPEISKGWITNKNWVINTPMETGIAPTEKAIPLLDKIRKENTGKYGPYLSAMDKNAMMTISTGVQAVAEAKYGRIDESIWYVNRIVETFNRVIPGSISEMMPDYGDFVQAWTVYGIVVPLIQHVFGIQPDAINKRIVFEPHLPSGWENISIDDLPVGTNMVSFSRSKSAKGIQYDVSSKLDGWSMLLKLQDSAGAQYYLNDKQISFDAAGIQLTGRTNRLLVKTQN